MRGDSSESTTRESTRLGEEPVPDDRTLDNPVQTPERDEFNRWPFSKRLADTIAAFDAHAGAPVIGIYGRWGYGKSSVLIFIRTQLESEHSNVVEILEFNPWRFKDQEALASAFFHGLASAIDKTLGGTGIRVGQILEYAGSLLTIIPVAGSAAGKVAEKVGARLAYQSLDEERTKIIEIMRESERKIVVLIDDLDRLDREEILSLLKMVRLTANFPQIVYVLAFDDEMVARAAGQSFGGTIDSGRQFLEKIVQYPFTIPAVGRRRLLNFIERRAQDACASAGITLDEKDWATFKFVAEQLLLPRLVTPRQAIRYGNALTFALPMLKGEVNTLDQILVEGMRVLFPEIYGFVRDNSPRFVVEDTPSGSLRYRPLEPSRRAPDAEGLRNITAKVMPNADDVEQVAGANLLQRLFGDPRRPGSISNARYFDRYFSYTINPDDITDAELQELLRLCGGEKYQEAGALLSELTLRNVTVLIGRLRAFAGRLRRELTERVARTLARNGALFDIVAVTARKESATLIAELILNCPGTTEQRGALALIILSEAASLPLVLLMFRELSSADFADKGKYYANTDVDPLLPDSAILDLRAAFVDRISLSAQTRPLYEEFEAADALSMLVLWNQERPAELKAYITARIRENPSEAAEILNVVAGSGWGNFQFLISMVDIDSFNAALDKHFAPLLAKGEWTSELSPLNDFRSYLRVRAGAGSANHDLSLAEPQRCPEHVNQPSRS